MSGLHIHTIPVPIGYSIEDAWTEICTMGRIVAARSLEDLDWAFVVYIHIAPYSTNQTLVTSPSTIGCHKNDYGTTLKLLTWGFSE